MVMEQEIRRFKFNGESVLSLPARPEAFATLCNWLDNIAAELQLVPKTHNQLLIVADEIFTNISSYGYPSGDGDACVAVDFDMTNEILTITFIDSGMPYNPLDTPPPDINAPLEEREIGGLGIFLVRNLMDSVEYTRENDCNVLILKKRISR